MAKNEFKFKYIKPLEKISRTSGRDALTIFNAFAKLTACALSAGLRENDYKEEAQKWEKEHLELFSEAFSCLIIEMENKPYTDILGEYYLSLKNKSLKGEFYTSKPICDLISKITSTEKQKMPIRIIEPSCGAGQMILSLANTLVEKKISPYNLRVIAIDIDYTATQLCFINTTLWGIPCEVYWGNALTNEFWGWFPNIHWRQVRECDRVNEMAGKMLEIINGFSKSEAKPKSRQATLFDYINKS